MKQVYRKMRRYFWLVLAIFLASTNLTPVQAQDTIRYFPETGHYLRGAFRSFWEGNGGTMVFGYPITEEYIRASDGKVVQYFERARFELNQQGNQASVTLGRLGAEYAGNRNFPKARPINNTADRRYIPETQYIIQYGFKTIWESHGAQRIFGWPISNELEEVIDDGKRHTVQYFENARFEFWPEFAPGKRVLITTLGRKLAPQHLIPPLPADQPPGGPIPESGGGAPAPAPAPAPSSDVPASQNARVSPESGPPGTTFVLDAWGFQPGEKVGVWLTAPTQSTLGADFQATADSNGSIVSEQIGITTNASFSEGIWSFNAQGVSSNAQAVGYFRITNASSGPAGNPSNLGTPIHDQLPRIGDAFIMPVAAPSGTDFVFMGGGFSPDEDVGSWITTPDQQNIELDSDLYYKEGSEVYVSFGTGGMPNGVYSLVVQGKNSGVVAAANFKLTNEFVAPPSTPRPESVNGTVTPQQGGTGVTFQLRGHGLQPNEELEYWETYPDGGYVLYDENLRADGQGRIGYEPPMNLYGDADTTQGVYGFHFRGRSSGARVDLYLTYTQ
jgi:hypothetical protein